METWWHRHNRELDESADPDMCRWTLPAHLAALLDAVERRFAGTATVPGWPDPHADPASPWGAADPREEEYSRVTAPERYRIVLERTEAWLAELTAQGLASVTELVLPPMPGPGETTGDAVWLLAPWYDLDLLRRVTPVRDGALPLLVGSWEPTPDRAAGVLLAAGDPAVPIEPVPDCGCDACDSGSTGLLQELDEGFLHVLDGSLRIDVDAGATRIRYADGASASYHHGREARERARTLGSAPHRYRGVAWSPDWPEREPADPV